MSKIENGGLDQYGVEPFEQLQFGIAGVKGVNRSRTEIYKTIHQEMRDPNVTLV